MNVTINKTWKKLEVKKMIKEAMIGEVLAKHYINAGGNHTIDWIDPEFDFIIDRKIFWKPELAFEAFNNAVNQQS